MDEVKAKSSAGSSSYVSHEKSGQGRWQFLGWNNYSSQLDKHNFVHSLPRKEISAYSRLCMTNRTLSHSDWRSYTSTSPPEENIISSVTPSASVLSTRTNSSGTFSSSSPAPSSVEGGSTIWVALFFKNLPVDKYRTLVDYQENNKLYTKET